MASLARRFQRGTQLRRGTQLLVAFAVIGAVLAPLAADSAGGPQIATDKASYAAGDQVLIRGRAWTPSTDYALAVKLPDGSLLKMADPSATDQSPKLWTDVKTDSSGSFKYRLTAGTQAGSYRAGLLALPLSAGGLKPLATAGFSVAQPAPVAPQPKAAPKAISGSRTNLGSRTSSGSTATSSGAVKTPLANPAANLDQCANGPFSAPVQCTGSAWVNGNLNGNQAHYREGDSVPYRMRLTGLATGNTIIHTLTIGWDTLASGKHAIDYLTSYDRTETDADPCSGVSGCGNPSDFPIPPDPYVVAAGITPVPGDFTCFNCAIQSVSAYTGPTGAGGEQTITLSFTADVADPVVAWGGHIANEIDWGAGNAAGSVNGSPYHMRLIDLDGFGGNQDRSLSSGAVPPPPVITTEASPHTVPIGSSVTDTATVTGNVTGGAVDGTVEFWVCGPAGSPPDCSTGGTQVGGAVPITPGDTIVGTATSDPFTPTQVGTYCFRAEYFPAPGSLYSEGEHTDTTLECFTVGKAAPSITTQLSESTGSIGDIVHDSATLTGATSDAGGTVTYTVYSDDTCSTQFADAGTKTVTNGSVPDSNGVTFNAAGTYFWQAVYSGDASNESATSDCTSEPLVIGTNPTSITTELSTTTASIGEPVHDSATLGGATSDAGGTVAYTVYSDDTCSTQFADAGTVTVTDGSVPDSDPVTFNAAATYFWQAAYSGDANNDPSTSACTDEALVIGTNPTTITTQLSQSTGLTGDTVHDSATLSGATSDAGGTVTYTVYSDNTCATQFADAGTVTVTDGSVPDSNAVTFNAAATYYWQAAYSGDANNDPSTSACTDEALVITAPTPSGPPQTGAGPIGGRPWVLLFLALGFLVTLGGTSLMRWSRVR
jgi:hypothetical protein